MLGQEDLRKEVEAFTRDLAGHVQRYWPDFQATKVESFETRKARKTAHRDIYLLPYINQEDLSKPSNLPLFLASRASHPPDLFAFHDFEGCRIGLGSHAIIIPNVDDYTMLLSRQDTPQSYGKIVSWRADATALSVMMSGLGKQPGEGLILLEIQETYLTFLVRCADLLLPDLDALATVHPTSMEPISLTQQESTQNPGLKSVAEAYAEAPYHVPQPFDFDRIQQLVAAKRAEAVDHIWALREDLSYFLGTLLDYSEHRQERILSSNLKKHPRLDTGLFSDFIANGVVVDAYCMFIQWNAAYNIVKETETIRDRDVQEPMKGPALPQAYHDKLYELQYFLERMVEGPIGDIKTSVTAGPQMRHLWEREPQQPGTMMIRTMPRDQEAMFNDPLTSLLHDVIYEQRPYGARMPNLPDEVDRLVRTDKRQAERVSTHLMDVLSNLAAIAELSRCLDFHIPKIQAEDNDVRNKRYEERITLFRQVYKVFLSKKAQLHDVVTPTNNLDYPSARKRTERNQDQIRAAEAKLDQF